MPEGEPGTPTWKFTQYVTSSRKWLGKKPASQALLAQAGGSACHMSHCPKSSGFSIVLSHLPPIIARLLMYILRCFGDKGDVEDITEGTSYFVPSDLSRSSLDPIYTLLPWIYPTMIGVAHTLLNVMLITFPQLISYQRLNLTIPAITWQQGTRAAESSSSSAMRP